MVITELERNTGTGPAKYSVAEYKNIAGRAGRLGMADHGTAIIMAHGTSDADHKWNRYVLGTPEPLDSALLHPGADLRRLILCAFAATKVAKNADITTFLAWSLAAHQRRLDGEAEPFGHRRVDSALEELVVKGMVRNTGHGMTATSLGDIVIRTGLSVDSVLAVSEALTRVSRDQVNRVTLIAAAQLTEELHDPRFLHNKDRWRKEHDQFAGYLRTQRIDDDMLAALLGDREQAVSIGRAKRTLACLLWSKGIELARIEDILTKYLPPQVRDAGPIEQAARRAADVIGAVIDIARLRHPAASLGALGDLLSAQLHLGIDEGLVPVALQIPNTFRREVYLALTRAGVSSVEAVLEAGPEILLGCVDGDPAQVQILVDAATAAKDAQDREQEGDLLPEPTD